MTMSESGEGLAKTLNLLNACSEEDKDQEVKFHNRLKTYIEGQKWIHRPHVISPAVCARYGWRCVSSQMLVCDTCSAKLIPGQLKIESFQTYKACLQKVQENLKTSHKELCPWPLTPCPENFVRMQPVHKELALNEFRSRLESLLILNNQLPEIKDDIPEKLGLLEETSQSLLKLVGVEKCERNRSATYLASTGWMNTSGRPKSLSCVQCQRTVALLLFNSVSSSSSQPQAEDPSVAENETTITEESPSKENKVPNGSKSDDAKHELGDDGSCDAVEPGQKRKSISDDSDSSPSKQIKRVKLSECPSSCFDPLFEHRPWCPWVVESSVREKKPAVLPSSGQENGYFTLPGWQLFIKCLLRNIGGCNTTTSPLKEQISSARSLLESWSTPA